MDSKLRFVTLTSLLVLTSHCSEPQNSSELSSNTNFCGAELGEFGGVVAYSNGEKTGTGQGCDRSKEANKYGIAYQCVELVARYFNVKYGAPYSKTCNASDCIRSFFNNYPDEFRVISNSTSIQPQSGDAIFFRGNPGHTGIITRVTETGITFLHQNARSGQATVSFTDTGAIGSYGSLPFLGLVRHRKAPIQPVRDIPKSINPSTPSAPSVPTVPVQLPQPVASQTDETPTTTTPPPTPAPMPSLTGPNCSVANVQHQKVSLWVSNCISYGGTNTPETCRGYCLGSCCTPFDAACRQACTEH